MVTDLAYAFIGFFDFLYSSFLLLSPMLLLGLFLSGLLHVFISRQAVVRWFHDESLKSVSTSAAIGVPMPLCSCSVVPVVAEMRRKGASRSACMSFLITAPETGADSILVTNAFFGWIAAIVRPIISFITAVVAGIFCIGMMRGEETSSFPDAGNIQHGIDDDHEPDCCDENDSDCCDDQDPDCCDDQDHHQTLFPGSDDCFVTPSLLKRMILEYLRVVASTISSWRFISWAKPDSCRKDNSIRENTIAVTSVKEEIGIDFKTLMRHIFRYGFVEIADDILFALLIGIVLGGLIYLAIPSDLMEHGYARWLSYPAMVIFGVPLYICASASTPIAAALIAKGFSPGAALIFLMTGPATNTGTIAIIISQFGTRFASIYVGIVIVVTVVLGIAIDLLLIATGYELTVNLDASESPALLALQWGGALALGALIIWRFRAGALKSGYNDLLLNLKPVFSPGRNMS
ncbi:MAG: SO_0444 family Cu/Zn efflux transporter [Gammaproteobacteria bacterium]|nr:SO_0444 family Cu/Zn efflux transporter [Gammaproteobacteria bacterium]